MSQKSILKNYTKSDFLRVKHGQNTELSLILPSIIFMSLCQEAKKIKIFLGSSGLNLVISAST